MPGKYTKQPIRPRGVVQVDESTGSPGTPSAIRTDALGQMHAPINISNNSSQAGSWARGLSKMFDTLSGMAEQSEANARMNAKRGSGGGGGSRGGSGGGGGEASPVLDGVDKIGGAMAGLELMHAAKEKVRSGEWTTQDVVNAYRELQAQGGGSKAFNSGLDKYMYKALEDASNEEFGRKQTEFLNNNLAVIRQGFHSLHSGYLPEEDDSLAPSGLLDPEYMAALADGGEPLNTPDIAAGDAGEELPFMSAYAVARQELYDSSKPLGINGATINQLEFESITSQAKRAAKTDPRRALALVDLADALRPDGSPSLAASLPGGFALVDALRDEVNKIILGDSKTEEAQAKQERAESAKDNYLNAVIAITQAKEPGALEQWESENILGKNDDELKALYGDFRSDLVGSLERAKSNAKPEGNDAALAEWSINIQRGDVEWEDIQQDSRLSDLQKAELYGKMRTITQQSSLGYIPDSHLAVRLLSELEESWPQSIYKSAWGGSQHPEPGKAPVATPEGLFYQGELFKRLRPINPELKPNASNRQKMEILNDLKNEILTGKLSWGDHAAAVGAPAPELKLSEKVKNNQELSPSEITTLGKLMNDGGAGKIREVHGLDFYTLDGQQQKRIGAEAQRQKDELKALREQSLSYRLFGDPETQANLYEREYQQYEEASRLLVEGMELNATLAKDGVTKIVVTAERLPSDQVDWEHKRLNDAAAQARLALQDLEQRFPNGRATESIAKARQRKEDAEKALEDYYNNQNNNKER